MYNTLNNQPQQEALLLLESEWRECANSPAYFIWNYVRIKHPDHGIVPFELWDFQIDDLEKICTEQTLIVLKARQLGLTTLLCAYSLWLMLFHDAKEVVVISKGQRESIEVVARIKIMYEYLPQWMKNRVKLVKDNEEIFMLSNKSVARSMPAKSGAGRGYSCSLLILDEAAFMPEAKEIYTGAKPTLGQKGKIIIISTGNGKDNFYHEMWQLARAGKSDESMGTTLTPIFHPWWVHPDRDDAWYENERRIYPDVNQFKQEYPAHEHEAFILKQGRFFPEFGMGIHCTCGENGIMDFDLNLPIYRAMDFGFAQQFVCLWVQIDSLDNVYIIKELMLQEHNAAECAESVLAHEVEWGLTVTGLKLLKEVDWDENGEKKSRQKQIPVLKESLIKHTYSDPSGTHRDYSGKSPYMTMERYNIVCEGERTNIEEGVDEIRQWLKNAVNQEGTGCLFVSRDCLKVIEMFEGLERDKNNTEYYRKDGKFDHCADAIKYLFRGKFLHGSLPLFGIF